MAQIEISQGMAGATLQKVAKMLNDPLDDRTYPDDAAFPRPASVDLDDTPKSGHEAYSTVGLNKREWFAGMALSGLLAAGWTLPVAATMAVAKADELIAALNEEAAR